VLQAGRFSDLFVVPSGTPVHRRKRRGEEPQRGRYRPASIHGCGSRNRPRRWRHSEVQRRAPSMWRLAVAWFVPRASTREEASGSRRYGGEGESLRGEHVTRAHRAVSVSAGAGRPARREQPFEADGTDRARCPTAWEAEARRRASISERSKALKTEAQGRFRGETNPGRSKECPGERTRGLGRAPVVWTHTRLAGSVETLRAGPESGCGRPRPTVAASSGGACVVTRDRLRRPVRLRLDRDSMPKGVRGLLRLQAS
jgi:hypothetical protein